MHKKLIACGHMLGFVLLGVGVYMLLLLVIPPSLGPSMWSKVSMVFGAVLLIGGLIWNFASPSEAQNVSNTPNKPNVTGMSIEGNNQGGPAAEIVNSGGPNPALDITAVAKPGESVTGLHVQQTGPGTGLKIIQNGPGTGVRVTVGTKP